MMLLACMYLVTLVLYGAAVKDSEIPSDLFYPFGMDIGDAILENDTFVRLCYRSAEVQCFRFGNSSCESLSIDLSGSLVLSCWDVLKQKITPAATSRVTNPVTGARPMKRRELVEISPEEDTEWVETYELHTLSGDGSPETTTAELVYLESSPGSVDPKATASEPVYLESLPGDVNFETITDEPIYNSETIIDEPIYNSKTITDEPIYLESTSADVKQKSTTAEVRRGEDVNLDPTSTEATDSYSSSLINRILQIAPFFCNVQIAQSGTLSRIYYRSTTDETLLHRAQSDVQLGFPSLYPGFQPRRLFIATWYKVSHRANQRSDQRNTFQAVLITDYVKSFVVFNYGSMNYFNTSPYPVANAPYSDGRCLTGITLQTFDFERTNGSQEIFYPDKSFKNCRFTFGFDGQIIQSRRTCKNENTFPSFKTPRLEGPVVRDRLWVEFYCLFPSKETRKDATYNVTFLFNGQPDNRIPSFVTHPPEFRATLNEKYLTNKHLGKWISCQVFSYWRDSHQAAQNRLVVSQNDYWIGIKVSPKIVHVYEGDEEPVRLTIQSTIPITCGLSSNPSRDTCDLMLRIKSTDKVLVHGKCSHFLGYSDWKTDEQMAYNNDDEVKLFAKIDPYYYWQRGNTLTIDIDPLPDRRSSEGERYRSMWSKHVVAEIQVYHHDSFKHQGMCVSTGDPHVMTFGYYWYTIYPSGQFTYIQTTHGTPIEVQARHKPCGRRVSCVCGVAMREGNVIIGADMCGEDRRIHYFTYNDDLQGAEIRQSPGGYSFEIVLPSKVMAMVYIYSWSSTLGLYLYVTSSEYQRIEGLCGSFDKNFYNDLIRHKDSKAITSVDEAVESWRVPLGQSLFDGVLSNLPNASTPKHVNDRQLSYCTCTDDDRPCGISRIELMPSANTINKVTTPKRRFARNTLSRRKRDENSESANTMTDDIDAEYDSSAFNFSQPQPSPDLSSWPKENNISEEQAKRHCHQVLWEDLPIKFICENFVNMTNVEGVINKCIADIKLTDDLAWADDKLSEIQNLCIFETLTSINTTESNASQNAESLVKEIEKMKALICLPQDCSGHGTCKNGTCDCNTGFIGSDCALSEDTVPKILHKIGSKSCELHKSPCQKVEFLTKNVSESKNLSCKIGVKKLDESRQESVINGAFETMQTTSCKLPTENFNEGLRILQSNADAKTEADETEFDSLPPGNPVLFYSVSISNNRVRFSNAWPFVVYDSRCFTCEGENCEQKTDTCLIRGYCFAKHQRNPMNPQCEHCDPSVSVNAWTRHPDAGEKHSCAWRSNDDVLLVVVVVIVTFVAVLLTVIAVFLIIRRR